MKTIITLWSKIGHTPITNRGAGYCDELAFVTIDCASPAEAIAATKQLIAETVHAQSGHFTMPDYPNQNTKNGFVM